MSTMSVSKRILKIEALTRKKESAAALALCQELMVEFPQNARARKLYKELEQQQVKPDKARLDALHNLLTAKECAQVVRLGEQIVSEYPRSFLAWNILGSAYHELNETAKALDAFENMLALKPNDADALYNLGTAYMRDGQLKRAIELMERSIAIRCEFAFAHFNLGNCFRDDGQVDQAIESYEQAIRCDPNYLASYTNLGQVKNFDIGDPKLEYIGQALSRPSTTEAEKCKIYFILAKAHEHAGDVEKTISLLRQGNEARRKMLGYEFETDIKLFKKQKTAAIAIGETTFQPAPRGNCPIPIFIVGMPRSGTTLFEQILTSHSMISGSGELPYVVDFGHKLSIGDVEPTQKNLAIFRKRYLRKITAHADGRPYVTDKMPSNFRSLALIMKALPEAIVFHATRDPRAVCWSNYKHNFYADGLGYSCRIEDTVQYHGLYRDIMHFWQDRFGLRIMEVNYEALIQNQRAISESVIEHIGLVWEEACLEPHKNNRKIKTASKMQVREKIYQGSSKKWQAFEPYLEDMFESLPSKV